MKPTPNPFKDDPNPYQSPETETPPDDRRGFQRHHRADWILILAVAAGMGLVATILCCPPISLLSVAFGAAAFMMGREDLRAMDDGKMDARGRTQTQIGMILGLTLAIISGAITALFLFAMLAMLVTSAWG